MHAISYAAGMPVAPDHAAQVDAYDLVQWTDDRADLLLVNGDMLVSRLEIAIPDAERLAEWLRDRLVEGGAVRLGEVLEQAAAG